MDRLRRASRRVTLKKVAITGGPALARLPPRWPEPRRHLGRRRQHHLCDGLAADRAPARVGGRRRADRPDEAEPRARGRAITSGRSSCPAARRCCSRSRRRRAASTRRRWPSSTCGPARRRCCCAAAARRSTCRAAIWSTPRRARCAPSRSTSTAWKSIGTARPVVPQVVTLPTGTAEFDIARDGTLVYAAGGGGVRPPRGRSCGSIAKDAKSRSRRRRDALCRPAAVTGWDARRARDRAIRRTTSGSGTLSGETLTRVTSDPGVDQAPVWMPDGRRLVFSSQTGGAAGNIFWQAADGTGAAERLTDSRQRDRTPFGRLARRHTHRVLAGCADAPATT